MFSNCILQTTKKKTKGGGGGVALPLRGLRDPSREWGCGCSVPTAETRGTPTPGPPHTHKTPP